MLPLAVLRCWDLPLDRFVPTGTRCAGMHLLTPVIMTLGNNSNPLKEIKST